MVWFAAWKSRSPPCIGRAYSFWTSRPSGYIPIARDAVWKHLIDLRANYGTTLFFTTHYLEEAESHCDRLAIMHLGKIAALGTCEELKATLGGESSTLSEVFTHYAGGAADSGGTFRDVSVDRATAKRLG